MLHIFIVASSIYLFLSAHSCSQNTTDPLPDAGPDTTSHDFVWSADTLSAQNALQLSIKGIWGSSPQDVWAIGHSDHPDHQIWHWNGTHWIDKEVVFQGRPSSLRGIFGFTANDIWCVGREFHTHLDQRFSFIAHYNGSRWNVVEEFTTTSSFSVWGNQSDNLFVGCDSGVVAHFDGTEWTSYQTDTPYTQIMSINGTEQNGIFALGLHGDFQQPADTTFYCFYKFEQNEWITIKNVPVPAGSQNIPFGVRLWNDGDNNLYSVGLGGLYRLNVNQWERIEAFESLRSIGGASSRDWFLGGFGQQIHHFNGTNWLTYTEFNDSFQFIEAIWTTEDNVFVSSTNGMITVMYHGQR